MSSSTDRRSDQRFSRRIRVRFWRVTEPKAVYSGYTTNVSRGGAFIETPKPTGRNARIRIEFSTEQSGFVIEAKVVRSIKVPIELRQVQTSGMGIRFLPLEELLLELGAGGGAAVDAAEPETVGTGVSGSRPVSTGTASAPRPATAAPAQADADPPPQQPVDPKEDRTKKRAAAAIRHPAASPTQKATVQPDPSPPPSDSAPPGNGDDENGNSFVLRFSEVESLRQIWERELQFGGLFIPTADVAPINSEVQLKVYLPGSEEPIITPARVVVVNPPKTDGESGSDQMAGIGVTLQRPAQLLPRVREMI